MLGASKVIAIADNGEQLTLIMKEIKCDHFGVIRNESFHSKHDISFERREISIEFLDYCEETKKKIRNSLGLKFKKNLHV